MLGCKYSTHLKSLVNNSINQLTKRNYHYVYKWTKPKYLEKHNGFYMDNRRGQREVVNIKSGTKLSTNASLRYEIADINDIDLYAQFLTDIYSRNCEFEKQADGDFDTILPCFYQMSEKWLPQQISFFVFDDDKLVGVAVNCIHKTSDFEKMFPYGYGHENPKLEMLPDYSEFIAKYDIGSRPSNVITAFIDEATARAGPFFPKDMKILCTNKCVGVHDDYRNTRLGLKMVDMSVELLKNHGCDSIYGHCVAKETEFISLNRIKGKFMVEIPFDSFVENGKSVFKPAPSGKTGDVVVFKKLI